ncbi:MAG TPA: AraC family transcriptional regulator [Chromatiales bacterium]|nr:AraC family transcriptional regulator [Thiotrichales bacterium]HIP68290.1 AraC family transcriptional regulator [Chromatiales bacterium]
MRVLIKSGLFFLLVMFIATGFAEEEIKEEQPQATASALDGEVQALKQDVLDLNKELFILEEELLFPSNTQVAIFVSMDVGDFFNLDSVQIKLNDKMVANYLYTPREVKALHRGGTHRIYMGNLPAGEHELIAFFTGTGPNNRDFKRGTEMIIKKEIGPKMVELKISDRKQKHQADFQVKEW